MQNNVYFFFVTALLFGCSNSPNEVTVTAENNSQDCHMCPGYLLIERGNTIDTLKMGSWGKPPSFNQFKANDRDYIALESSYFSGGINESKLSILSLNKDNYLTSVFDTLISDEQIDYFKINRRGLEFRAPDTLLVHQHNEISNSNDESSIRADYLSELYIIESLSSGTKRITITLIIESSWGGRGDQGGLVVSNGDQIDTIYDCTYGRTPDYKILKYGSREYLFTSCLINGGGTNWQTFYLWSLNDTSFMKQLFFKQLYTGKEGPYNSETGDLTYSNSINIHPLTDKIKTWIRETRVEQMRNGKFKKEEIHWLLNKKNELSLEENKVILTVDSTYNLLNMSSDDIPSLEIFTGKKKYEFELGEG
ncbi:MAG: hypothetical protein ACI9AU_000384 [Bacteroidia bacterium]|jgi:hypothetical protein